MSEWKITELKKWDQEINQLSSEAGLDWFPIVYEICDYYEMIGHMAYHGMPSHYNHWSYGKSFERTHQRYNMGVTGLPYELIINSNPSIAYLMRENPLYLQILIMAHCVGHSDFFKNNNTFAHTYPEIVTTRFRNAKKRIQTYIEDPSIGVHKVENILDAAHAISFQTILNDGNERKSHKELLEEYTERIKNDKKENWKHIDLNIVPLEPDPDLLGFLIEHGNLEDWEADLISIVKFEAQYFLPQMKTKIINEGWASFWHFKTMNALNLEQKFHIPFLKSHNQVIRPHIGGINPYHVGIHLFQKIEKKMGIEECFFARDVHHDVSFLMEHLEQEDCIDLNLFTYSRKKYEYSVDEVSDDNDWKTVKRELIKNIGTASIPLIFVDEIETDGTLVLGHEHDGRDLEIQYANQVVKHIKTIWKKPVRLITLVEGEPWIID